MEPFLPVELADLSARLKCLGETGDLSALGALRQTGDAPGRDPEGVPRPSGSRRVLVLFAAEHGMLYAITAYAVDGSSVKATRQWYRAGLESRGRAVEQAGRSLVARRASRVVVVRVSQTAGRVAVTLAELA